MKFYCVTSVAEIHRERKESSSRQLPNKNCEYSEIKGSCQEMLQSNTRIITENCLTRLIKFKNMVMLPYFPSCSFKLQQLKNLSDNVTSLEWISTDVQTLQELRMDFQSTQVYFSLQDVHLVFHYQHPLPSNIKGSKIWSVIKKY